MKSAGRACSRSTSATPPPPRARSSRRFSAAWPSARRRAARWRRDGRAQRALRPTSGSKLFVARGRARAAVGARGADAAARVGVSRRRAGGWLFPTVRLALVPALVFVPAAALGADLPDGDPLVRAPNRRTPAASSGALYAVTPPAPRSARCCRLRADPGDRPFGARPRVGMAASAIAGGAACWWCSWTDGSPANRTLARVAERTRDSRGRRRKAGGSRATDVHARGAAAATARWLPRRDPGLSGFAALVHEIAWTRDPGARARADDLRLCGDARRGHRRRRDRLRARHLDRRRDAPAAWLAGRSRWLLAAMTASVDAALAGRRRFPRSGRAADGESVGRLLRRNCCGRGPADRGADPADRALPWRRVSARARAGRATSATRTAGTVRARLRHQHHRRGRRLAGRRLRADPVARPADRRCSSSACCLVARRAARRRCAAAVPTRVAARRSRGRGGVARDPGVQSARGIASCWRAAPTSTRRSCPRISISRRSSRPERCSTTATARRRRCRSSGSPARRRSRSTARSMRRTAATC